MSTFAEIMILLAISKEAVEIGSLLPFELWALFLVALPYFLGMGHSVAEARGIVPSYLSIRHVIGQGVGLASLAIFLGLISYRGVAPEFWTLFLLTMVFYGIGRLFALTVKALLLLGSVVAGLLLFGITAL